MQFNRMVQGLTSAPACWDQAMGIIFSDATLTKLKAKFPKEQAELVPDSFQDFFTYYQDDSWIFSDTPEEHLLHLKLVLQAYIMHDIRISPQKSTFFPDSFKILGVSFAPQQAELFLDRVKAQSILDWEKPNSLFTLQSRIYALNYWTKFIPNLAELKFPLNQILRSGIFSWTQEADDAWENIKVMVALDIKLTIPNKDEQLLITTDASKVACSCILWVCRSNNLKVVGCYSKLFSHADSLKNIHFQETYALVQAFSHFRPYLLNTTQTVIVFTNARTLIWVSRNREYNIAWLVNKLAKIQLEIPHKIFSVPSEVNYPADLSPSILFG
jgi:RNase H-like domain found in reverse transcriptase/Reverse transcriptase (RNA-dependent DNA polymerase)